PSDRGAASSFSLPRWMAVLAVVALAATLAAAALAYVLAQRSDDRLQRERREGLIRALDDHPAVFADGMHHRAAELGSETGSRAALEARLAPTGNARFQAAQVFVLEADGTPAASFPAGETVVPQAVQQLASAMRSGAVVVSDFITVGDQPALA